MRAQEVNGRVARILLSVGVTLLLLKFPLVPAPINAQASVTVSIDAPAEVAPDSHFTARVNITEVSDFDACQFDVTYDPSVVEMIEATDGEIGGTIIPIGWGLIPAGKQGRVRVIGNVPGVFGVNGSGYLAEIHFHVISSPGNTSNIDLSNGVLGDKYADPITPVTWVTATLTVTNPSPFLTSLSPVSATAGGPTFTLTVNGTNFIAGSTVHWNGTPRTTTFVSSTQLLADITALDITTVGVASVTVVNPAPGGGTSNALDFEIVKLGPAPPSEFIYLPLVCRNATR